LDLPGVRVGTDGSGARTKTVDLPLLKIAALGLPFRMRTALTAIVPANRETITPVGYGSVASRITTDP
jgi:hypothetical protein